MYNIYNSTFSNFYKAAHVIIIFEKLFYTRKPFFILNFDQLTKFYFDTSIIYFNVKLIYFYKFSLTY